MENVVRACPVSFEAPGSDEAKGRSLTASGAAGRVFDGVLRQHQRSVELHTLLREFVPSAVMAADLRGQPM
eukprot:6629010-Heterocapsa_arctica.AAC.1